MWLAHQLRKSGINSRTLRFGGQTAKGYILADVTESFYEIPASGQFNPNAC